ncbi:Glutathione S-transferase (GST) [Phytophthora cactorum]|nr:Glutathione S-transferase (GST) [Phytophthora cactorum]
MAFPAEKGRYHLYVTYSCPFACRALSARNLLGLEDVISVSIAHPMYQKTKPNDASDEHKGWVFVDPATSATMVGANGRHGGPGAAYILGACLWDKKKGTIVSEESTGILRTLDSGFRDLVPSNVHLYPEDCERNIDAVNDGICAETNEELTKLDELLTKKRFLIGKSVTEADVRLFHTLIRLDSYQQTTDKHLTDYHNIEQYLRELYQIPELKSTVNWYHAPHVTAEGPFVDYDAAHDRAKLE